MTAAAAAGKRKQANFFVASTIWMFFGALVAIATYYLNRTSNSHALAPYVSGFCSRYATGSMAYNPNDATNTDRLQTMELKLEELVLAIKTLADTSVSISSKLDSELASTGRSLEEIAERLHRVENHVYVSEDLA